MAWIPAANRSSDKGVENVANIIMALATVLMAVCVGVKLA